LKEKTAKAIDKALDKFEKSVQSTLTENATKAHVTGSLKGYKNLGIVPELDLVRSDSIAFAKAYKDLLVNEGATIIKGEKIAWLKDHKKETREKVHDIIQKGLEDGKSPTIGKESIAKELGKVMKDQEYRMKRIARTEIAYIQNKGTVTSYKNNKVTKVQVLDNEGPNSCPECEEANGQIWTLEYAETHELEHPNCVRAFIPIIDDLEPETPIEPETTEIKTYDDALDHFKEISTNPNECIIESSDVDLSMVKTSYEHITERLNGPVGKFLENTTGTNKLESVSWKAFSGDDATAYAQVYRGKNKLEINTLQIGDKSKLKIVLEKNMKRMSIKDLPYEGKPNLVVYYIKTDNATKVFIDHELGHVIQNSLQANREGRALFNKLWDITQAAYKQGWREPGAYMSYNSEERFSELFTLYLNKTYTYEGKELLTKEMIEYFDEVMKFSKRGIS